MHKPPPHRKAEGVSEPSEVRGRWSEYIKAAGLNASRPLFLRNMSRWNEMLRPAFLRSSNRSTSRYRRSDPRFIHLNGPLRKVGNYRSPPDIKASIRFGVQCPQKDNRMKIIIFAIAAFLLFASAASAQGSIEGTLTDAKGKGVANVTVTVVGANGKPVATAKTDESGAYTFNDVAAGKYKVVATGTTGYKPAFLDDVEVEDEAATTLDITLVAAVQAPVPKPTATPVPPKPVVQTPPQPGVNLRVGQKFSVFAEIKTTSVASIMDQNMENSSVDTRTTIYEVAAVEADSIVLKATVSVWKVDILAMGLENSFDSTRNDNSGPMADRFGKVVGKPRTLTISRSGRIIKEDRLIEADDLIVGSVRSADIDGNELFEPAVTLPDLKPGTIIPSTVIGPARTEGSFLVNSVLRGTAGLTYTGKGQSTTKVGQMGVEIDTNVAWTENTALQVDLTTHIVLSRNTTRDQKFTLEAGGMQTPVQGKVTIIRKVTLLN
jgi:hypothetical protein